MYIFLFCVAFHIFVAGTLIIHASNLVRGLNTANPSLRMTKHPIPDKISTANERRAVPRQLQSLLLLF